LAREEIQRMQKITLTEKQVKLLLSFAPSGPGFQEVPEGMFEVFYHTGSYKGDVRACQEIDEIRKLVE